MSDPNASAVADLVARARENPAPLSDWAERFLADIERRTKAPTERQTEILATIADRVSLPDLSRMLAERIADLAVTLAGEPTDRGRTTWRFRSRGSLAVEIGGPKRGQWFDHEAGEGGDALGLVAHLRREPLPAAYGWALAWAGGVAHLNRPGRAGGPVAAPEAPREASPPATLDMARRLWREAVQPAGTLVETYLAARGLKPEAGAPPGLFNALEYEGA